MSLGAMSAAMELGLSVPSDLSIIGVDDIEAAALVVPGLTTLKQPTCEIGACAVGILADLIRSPEGDDEAGASDVGQRVFEARLIVRGSCAPRQ